MKYFFRLLVQFGADRRGAVSLLTAFALPALIGTLALGTEVSYWLIKNRGLQNAADSAVIAASIDASSSYLSQAKAVAASYGFVDGVSGAVVTASNATACPAGGNDCFSVTVATTVPSYMGAVVGYVGAGRIGGVSGTRLSAIAYAKPSGTAHQYCLIALANDGTDPGIASSGAPKADLSGCGVMSNTGERCNGHDLGAAYGDAVGTDNGCGAVQTSNVKPFVDPYAALAAKLPADACGGAYPQTSLPAANKWTGTRTLGSVTTICGNLQLTGNVAINAPSDAVLIIRNGSLDTAGYSFTTAAGSGLAVVFTGTNSASYQYIPTGSGALDIVAPTTGVWSGVALYQDPSLKVGIQVSNAASAPTWALTGLIYVPHANLDFQGSVGKGGSGKRCTVIVANSVVIKGTGLVLSTVECGAAGLAVPNNGASGRGVLVG